MKEGSAATWTFVGPAQEYGEWLTTHPEGFVIAVNSPQGNLPRTLGGDIDFGALQADSIFPVIHRATCSRIVNPESDDQMTCGIRDAIEELFTSSLVEQCSTCFPR